ncbi:uncharacterized protein LOC119377625, partial [Rhipicephalus sanguineus]
MACLQLPLFDDTRDKWKPYLLRAEAYFEANDITDSKKQRALLVAALSTQTVQVLAGRIAPQTPNSLTYAEAVAALNSYYDPKRHETAESYKFFTRCQQEGESIQAFLVDIRRIADNCNFGSALDRMLRDRIICGVRSNSLRKQLLTKEGLTLEEAEAIVISAEAAENDANEMSAEAPAVLKVQARPRSFRDNPNGSATLTCGRCGSSRHDENACRWAKARCFRCGRRGHLARLCYEAPTANLQGGKRVQSVKALTATQTASSHEDSDEASAAQVWTVISEKKNGLEPPIRRKFLWGDVELPMEIDTGSPVCVISRQIYEQHRAQWPRLTASRLKLSCYAGRLPVLGELELSVRYKNVSVMCTLMVLDCAGPSLCGRDLITALSKRGVPIVQLTAPDLPAVPSSAGYLVNGLLADYADVLSADLGLIKGPPASLKLKATATPKFCRQFTLVTDHQPLLGLLRPDRQTPTMAAARIQRWALFLGGYQYKLQYVPGKQLLTADALSRLPAEASGPPSDGDPPEYVLSLDALDEGIVTTHELQEQTAKDPVLVRVIRYILHGWPRTAKGMEQSLLPFFYRKLELSWAHKLVYWGNRVVIPASAQGRMLQLLHETHQGSSSMKSVARSLFWWSGVDRDIEDVSAQCKNCVQNLPMPAAAPPVSWPKTLDRWSRIHIDFAGPIAGPPLLQQALTTGLSHQAAVYTCGIMALGQNGHLGTYNRRPEPGCGAPKAPDIRGEDEEASAAEQPPTGHIDDFDRLAQQVPDVEATAATTDQELPLL